MKAPHHANRTVLPVACLLLFSVSILDDGSKRRVVVPIDPVGSIHVAERRACASAILIATGSDTSYPLTSAADGVRLDIDADGVVDRIGWTRPNSDVAFLAVDRDGDNAITAPNELVMPLPNSRGAFAALLDMAKAANNGEPRGSVNSDDTLFPRLVLWTDRNHNGRGERSELRPVAEVFSDIGLGYAGHHRADALGNEYRYQGWAHLRTAPGRNRATSALEDRARRRYIYDVCLAGSPRPAKP